MYTYICLRHSCDITLNFTCIFIIFIANWEVHQLCYELPKCSSLQRIGQYTSPHPLHIKILYSQVTFHHPVPHEGIPSLDVFGPFRAGEYTIFSESTALLLSRRTLLCSILYPCASINYYDRDILAMASSIPIISSSVELFLFIFCFVEKPYNSTLPRYIMPHVRTLQYFCIVYEVSTQNFTTDMSPILKVRFSFRVYLS